MIKILAPGAKVKIKHCQVLLANLTRMDVRDERMSDTMLRLMESLPMGLRSGSDCWPVAKVAYKLENSETLSMRPSNLFLLDAPGSWLTIVSCGSCTVRRAKSTAMCPRRKCKSNSYQKDRLDKRILRRNLEKYRIILFSGQRIIGIY